MREVEIKAVLRDPAVVIQKLEEQGVSFSAPVSQEDVIYSEKVGSLETYLSNARFLRIRTRGDGQILFTLKYNASRNKADTRSVPQEHEVTISSKSEMEHMLALLGYTEAVRVRKMRRSGTYKQWEICIDDVEHLGSFMEVEQLAEEDADTAPIHAAMEVFLLTLGILKDDMHGRRYDTLMLEKNLQET